MTPVSPEGGRAARLPNRLLLFYALPAFALAMPTIPLYVYLPTLYADSLAVGLAATGAALLVARVFDVVTDPLIGLASDRFRLRFGRRKPWIAAGGLVAAVALVMLFDPRQPVDAVYLGLWAVVLFTGWTMVSVPYNAWGAELSTDYHQRARITGAREAAMILGILAAGSAPAVAAAIGASEADGIAAVGWLAVAAGLPAIALLLLRVAEPPAPAAAARGSAAPAPVALFAGGWRAIVGNRPFLRLLSGWFVNGLANGLPSVLFPLYLEYVLQAEPVTRGILIMVYFLAGILAIPVWVWLSRRYGKHRVWCWAMLLACAAFVWVPFLSAGDIVGFFVVCVITGFALGADLALPPAMQADVIDYDTLRTGQQRAGLFFALWSMSSKLALAAAVGIAFPLLQVVGFALGEVNTPAALLSLALLYAAVPTVLKLVAVAIVWNHPITARRQQAIRRRLDANARRIAPEELR